ncbi:hypothetical protein SteCoe_2160 [Stentor coeruleus]|uniref:Uncharacterized protein n=1 Tax=Stentor coeruleus TaxID=5963 RepID=A0A1R2D090_9CILI|nr:hypothetical protein SteCoe_2160 [Stentor coeruleus]
MDYYSDTIRQNTGYQLSEFPDSIAQGELISTEVFKELELSYFKGYQDNEFKYIIRKFVGSPIIVNEFITEEVEWINLECISYSQVLYCFIIKEFKTKIEYTLITRRYKNTFKDIANCQDENLKIEVLLKLAQKLLEMQQKEIYNVCLNQDFIYFTEEREILIGDHFWTKRYVKKKKIIDVIQLAKDEFLAPELRILKNFESKQTLINIISLLSASSFSFGLLSLSLFEISVNLNLQDRMVWVERIFDPSFKVKNKTRIAFSLNIDEKIMSKQLKDVLSSCLKTVSSKRSCYKNITRKLYTPWNQIKNKQEMIKPDLLINTEVANAEKIAVQEFIQCCDYFLDTIYMIHSKIFSFNNRIRKIFGNEPPSNIIRRPLDLEEEEQKEILYQARCREYNKVKNEIADIIKKYTLSRLHDMQEIFLKGNNLFYASRCDSEDIKYEEGLVSFFYIFHKDMSSNYGCAEGIIDAIIENNSSPPHYDEIIENFLKEENKLKKDTFLFGLISLAYQSDWFFFFPSDNSNPLNCKDVEFLRENNMLIEKIKKFLTKKPVLKILAKYLENTSKLKSPEIATNDNLEEENYEVNNLEEEKYLNEKIDLIEFTNIITNAINQVYVLQMPPSLYGLATYNQKIYVKPFCKLLKPNKLDSQAAMLLTIFHELVHYIRRINCRTYAESWAIYTPKSENAQRININFMSECENMLNKSEEEVDAELQLLGKRMKNINESAGMFLFNGDINDLESFRTQLFKENKKVGESQTSMAKISLNTTSFFGLKCGVSHR